MLHKRFLDLYRCLNEEGVEYLVVGAAALSLHGILRGTEDLEPAIVRIEGSRGGLSAAACAGRAPEKQTRPLPRIREFLWVG